MTCQSPRWRGPSDVASTVKGYISLFHASPLYTRLKLSILFLFSSDDQDSRSFFFASPPLHSQVPWMEKAPDADGSGGDGSEPLTYKVYLR